MFEVGDRVVCVDAEWRPFPSGSKGSAFLSGRPCPLQKGVVYTVREVGLFRGHRTHNPRNLCLFLAEVKNVGAQHPYDMGWGVWRFRKLRDISQSLAELKALTINCPPLVSA